MKLGSGYKSVLILAAVVTALLMVSVSGCSRGQPSKLPPIHLNPNMDDQPKYEAQEASAFFADSAAMRPPVPGTVQRDNLRLDAAFYFGMNSRGDFIKSTPVTVNMPLLKRGRERYDIFCAPCHSRVGDGRGIMVNRGYVPPPTFHSDRLRDMPDGEIYNVIANGIRNMPNYEHQIPPRDRWAIVAYLRALQRSKNADLQDIPEELRNKVLEQGGQ